MTHLHLKEVSNHHDDLDLDFDDLFNFLELDPVDVIKEKVAADLATLISFSGVKRKDLAKKLGWKESHLSKTLSGRENLTIKSISRVALALDYDFDVVFHKNTPIPMYVQPWEDIGSYLFKYIQSINHLSSVVSAVSILPSKEKEMIHILIDNSVPVITNFYADSEADSKIDSEQGKRYSYSFL